MLFSTSESGIPADEAYQICGDSFKLFDANVGSIEACTERGKS